MENLAHRNSGLAHDDKGLRAFIGLMWKWPEYPGSANIEEKVVRPPLDVEYRMVYPPLDVE